MAEQNEETTGVDSSGASEEPEQVKSGLYNSEVMIIHRGDRPILAIIIQIVRNIDGTTKYRIKQEFPDTPRYFPMLVWYDTEQEAKDAAETWVSENIHHI